MRFENWRRGISAGLVSTGLFFIPVALGQTSSQSLGNLTETPPWVTLIDE